MPTHHITTSSTTYPYYVGNHWSTSTTTDCSGFTDEIAYKRYIKNEIEWIKRWLENHDKSAKEPEITDEEILSLIEGDT